MFVDDIMIISEQKDFQKIKNYVMNLFNDFGLKNNRAKQKEIFRDKVKQKGREKF